MGAAVELRTLPGYLPRVVCDALAEVYRGNAVSLVGEDGWWDSTFGAGSTDLGDISHVMPAIEAQANGCSGTGHGADYAICDEETAYLTPAKAAAMTLVDLLCDGAPTAKGILADFRPTMSRDRYLEFMRGLDRDVVWAAPDE